MSKEPVYELTMHGGDLRIVEDADGWFSVMLFVDGAYADRTDAEATLPMWEKALKHAQEVLPTDLELRWMQGPGRG